MSQQYGLFLDAFSQKIRRHESIVIAVTGGSGSGKTVISEFLQKKYPNHVTILPVDLFEKQQTEELEKACIGGVINWDDPVTVDDEYIN